MVQYLDGRIGARVIGSLAEYLFAPDGPERVLERLTSPATRIVTLTITEGGYNVHPVTGEFDKTVPAIQADLRPGAVPTTVFGYLTEALRRRRARHIPPFTIASCDNLPGNGNLARRMFAAFADLAEPGLGDWVRAQVVLPALRANLVAGRDRCAEGTDDAGQPIDIADPLRDELMARAARQRENPLSFVRNEHLFGDLASTAEFAAPYRRAPSSFERYGARETLRRVNAERGRSDG
jgi:mannitol-1-phosphate/altronate dehydrogenase